MSLIRHIMYVFFVFILTVLTVSAQTESELKENASELFENEQYVEATSLYLRLLSLSPKSSDYNFRYGTCLLFNSHQKKEGIRYLRFAVKNSSIDPRAFYFYGRALHLNYQFKEAKEQYQKYLGKRSKRDNRYNVERDIRMCESGKKLLSSFTDIIVTEKKEIDQEKFFRIYGNMESIGGTILVSAEFQSKLDKKKGHIPIVHFPPQAKEIYYASYGKDESTGKDIYVRRRLPNGKWGEPQKIPGKVNTNEDEDFPYMHPDGKSLYFSSKGHNSMGGYDVFVSNKTPSIFEQPKNVDFAICSPDDDLFYVVDKDHQNAYFASARQSQDGKLHVYRVKVDRVPVQEVIIMGDFLSEVNPDNKKMSITISEHQTGKEVGKIKSNSVGKYSFVFPKGGKYDYAIKVDEGEDTYNFVVDVPFLKEFKPLKQKAIHKTTAAGETVLITNHFGESPDGAEAMIAEVIRKKSKLEVNADQYDLKAIQEENERNEALAALGFENLSMQEISTRLEDLAISEKLNTEKIDRIDVNMNAEIIEKSETLEELNEKLKENKAKQASTTDTQEKHQLLLEQQKLENQKLLLAKEIESLSDLRKSTLSQIGQSSETSIGKIEVVENQFNALIASGKEDQATELLVNNKTVLDQTGKKSPNEIVDDLMKRSTVLNEELKTLSNQQLELEESKRQLEKDIRSLKEQIPNAKKKELENLQSDLSSKTSELEMVESMLEKVQKDLVEKHLKATVLDNNIASLQTSMLKEPVAVDNSVDVNQLVAEAKEAATEVEQSTVEEQIASIQDVASHQEAVDSDQSENMLASISKEYEEQKTLIQNDGSISEEEKLSGQIDFNEEVTKRVDERLKEINDIVDSGNGSGKLEEEKNELEAYKNRLEEEKSSLKQAVEESNQTTNDVALSNESVTNELDATYADQVSDVEQNNSLTEKEQLEQLQKLDQDFLRKVEEDLSETNQSIENTPMNDEALQKRKEILESIREEKRAEIAEREEKLNSVEDSNLAVNPLTSEEVIEELDNNYLKDLAKIQKNGRLSEKDKLEALQEVDQTFLDKVNAELDKTNDLLEDSPENAELKQKKNVLESIQQEKERLLAARGEELQTLNDTAAVNSQLTSEDITQELDKNYTRDFDKIQENTRLSESERLEELQELDQKFLAKVNAELTETNELLENTPEDKDLQQKKKLLESIQAEKEGGIAEREQTLNAMENVSSVVNKEDIIAEIESELSNFDEKESEVREDDDQTAFEKEESLLKIQEEKLQELVARRKNIEKSLENDVDNQELIIKKDVLSTLIAEQEEKIKTDTEKLVSQIGEDQIVQAIENVDRKYSVQIGELYQQKDSPEKFEKIEKREQELQENLEQALASQLNQLEKEATVEGEVNAAILKKALAESKERESVAVEAQTPIDVVDNAENEEQFLTALRASVLGNDEALITEEFKTKNELESQDQVLANYVEELENRYSVVQDELTLNPDDETLSEQGEWLEKEISKVKEKRRTIRISLGELETVVESNPTNEESNEESNEIAALKRKEEELSEQLNTDDLAKGDRKRIEKELEKAREERLNSENKNLQEEINSKTEESSLLLQELSSHEEQDTEMVNAFETYSNEETEKISELVAEANNTDSEVERNYLLLEAEKRQSTLKDEISNTTVDLKIAQIEESSEVQLLTREELEQKRRRFTVQIGELTTDILAVEESINSAKKKELDPLLKEKKTLEAKREVLEIQLRTIEERLLENSPNNLVVSEEASNQEITFNEERAVSAKDEYKEYYELASEALEIEEQITTLDEDLREQRAAVKQLLAETENATQTEGLKAKIDKIKALEEEVDRLNIELIQAKYAADAVLPSDEEEAMKMQNLIMRGIKPIKVAAVATAILQMPTTGLAITKTTEAESPYSEVNPIPVDVAEPSGLVYRVQVGAFARPIPQDLFKEFNPVSGEKIKGTNITRYMAGFFNNSDKVVNAREEIRSLGYSDAFVVAYCDGERITFGEARRREREGTCIPKGTNEIMLEVAENTAEALGIPLESELQEVPELAYNQAPDAAEADPIEQMEGLFFTVQVGVFNRPVSANEVFNLPELMTFRLSNGQIRYNTGIFDSAEDAIPRQSLARKSGVQGAFITAYYKGERISISNARRLLIHNGNSILQSEINKEKELEKIQIEESLTNVESVDVKNTISARRKKKPVDHYLQVATKRAFDEFPRDVLNRYNAEGFFYYDEKDGRVKSIMYRNEDDMPRLWNFVDDIDTLKVPLSELSADSSLIFEISLNDSILSGDFVDWLMRFNYRKEFKQTEEGKILRIYGIEPNKRLVVRAIIRRFALEAVIVEKTEQELELEERY